MGKINTFFLGLNIVGLLLFVNYKIEAQSTLQLLNGKQIPIGKVINADRSYITYETLHNASTKRILTNRVFSEIAANGTEKVFYRIDSLEEMLFTEAQMRSFIKGRQEAKLNYSSPLAIPLGLVFGVAGGYSATVFPAVALFPPAVGLLCASFTTPQINTEKLSDLKLLNDEAFVQGYIEKARSKRFSRMLIGTGIGLVGVLAKIAFFPSK